MTINPELTRAVELSASGDNEAALALVQNLVKQGDPDALYTFADMHWHGALVECDWGKAVNHFTAAEQAGSEQAGHVVTNLMANGVAGARDWPTAIKRLSREASGNEQRASVLRLVEAMDLDDSGDPAVLPKGEQFLASPDVQVFEKLFTPAECQHLCALAHPMLAPSLVTGANLEQIPDPIRTSDCAPINDLIEDPAVTALNRRLAVISQSEHACGEPLLILRYQFGQHYLHHLDALPGLTNQRVKTALVYLNDGYEGGHTAFPAADQVFRGATGDAIVFRNTLDDGRPDQQSIHAGLPVLAGEKFLASRWIRERPIYDQNGPVRD